jgi:hypothetical protein
MADHDWTPDYNDWAEKPVWVCENCGEVRDRAEDDEDGPAE